MVKIFDKFSLFSGLRPNKSKYELTSIAVLKKVKMSFCGMESINLNSDSTKTFGIHFSYNNQITSKEHFVKDWKRSQILKWEILKLNVKWTVFKELAVSKIIHLVLVVNIVVISMIKELNKIQRELKQKC